MKKNLKTISKYLLLLILLVPCFVKADMGTPMFTEYQVRVTNPNGTTAVDYDGKEAGTFKYDEIITVHYEKIINNELYGGTFQKLVKLNDTKLVTDVVDLEKFKKERKQKYYVFDDTNVLYKGPSKTYGKVEPETTLKQGSTIETEYYDELWAYVEQDGVKGWVYTYTYTFGAPYEEHAGMAYLAEDYRNDLSLIGKTINEVNLYKSPKEKEVIATISKDTDIEVEIKYFYNDEPYSPYYYVSYNGKEGWMKYGTKIEGITYYTLLSYPNGTYTVDNNDGISMYKDYNSTSEILETIPHNTILNVKYVLGAPQGWSLYQVEYNGKIGWVKGEKVKVEINESITPNPEENPSVPDEELDQEENLPITNEQEEEKITTKQMIIICVVGALILSLTAFVTIKLINKKKETEN